MPCTTPTELVVVVSGKHMYYRVAQTVGLRGCMLRLVFYLSGNVIQVLCVCVYALILREGPVNHMIHVCEHVRQHIGLIP